MKTKTSKKKKKSMRYKYCVQPPIQITKPYSNFHLLDRKSVLNTESELETILSGAKKKNPISILSEKQCTHQKLLTVHI